MSKLSQVSDLLNGQPVVPVVVIQNEQQAMGLAKALLDGGISVIEITLRNGFGITAIELIKREFPQMVVLAGTVNTVDQFNQVADAGVDGVISPGISTELAERAYALNMPYLPGVATASEVMVAIQHGLSECKLFPAAVVGGISALKAFAGPFGSIRFCPTGGVSSQNYQDFLALDNVMCVGGTWVAPSDLVEQESWDEITARCKKITDS